MVTSRSNKKFVVTNGMLTLVIVLFSISLYSIPSFAASKESKLKAAFIYQFAKFVKWPGDIGDDINVGIYGQDTFSGALNTIDGKTAQGKTISIRKITDTDSLKTCCQIVFFSASEQSRYQKLLGYLSDTPTLTIGDQEGFIGSSGMIKFVKKGTKLKFIINRKSAVRANLSLSSQMLKVGIVIDD